MHYRYATDEKLVVLTLEGEVEHLFIKNGFDRLLIVGPVLTGLI
ncbi:MAG: hypothetical protein ACJAX5_002276 [Patiriisocius sp.]|jgi:hypothetical protein